MGVSRTRSCRKAPDRDPARIAWSVGAKGGEFFPGFSVNPGLRLESSFFVSVGSGEVDGRRVDGEDGWSRSGALVVLYSVCRQGKIWGTGRCLG